MSRRGFRLGLRLENRDECEAAFGGPPIQTRRRGFFLILVAGCAGNLSSLTPGQTSVPSIAATASRLPEPSLVDAAPAELVGSWRTKLDSGDELTLTLSDKSYRLRRGPSSGSGRIAVRGDEIEFSGSNLCEGTGTYRWSIDGDRLTFTAFGPADPCGGRVLDGQVYVRLP
jgi:hypothetical protein